MAKIVQTAGRKALGEFAPDFAAITMTFSLERSETTRPFLPKHAA